MSSRPYLDSALSTSAATSVSLVTSVFTNVASPPAFLMSATVSLPSFSRRPETTTFAPSRANAMAVARPIPLVAPVTRATLLVNLFMEQSFRLNFGLESGCNCERVQLVQNLLLALSADSLMPQLAVGEVEQRGNRLNVVTGG